MDSPTPRPDPAGTPPDHAPAGVAGDPTPAAGRPAILAVDDEPAVGRAVERDLKRRYGGRYRVLRAESGRAALDTLEQLGLRGTPVALLVADQRMPAMTGVEFLAEARRLAPDAKRVLLTAYADTDAAIQAINRVRVDHYLLKPWDPPEQELYPVLDDLLDDWRARYLPPDTADQPGLVRVIADRWGPAGYAVRDFLAGHQVPYRWLDVERDPAALTLARAALDGPNGTTTAPAPDADGGAVRDADARDTDARVREALPLVLVPGGAPVLRATPGALAEHLGLRTRPTRRTYDVAIVGGGPAGLAAAVYGASEGLATVLVEDTAPGGQAGQSSRIENYLGFPVGLSGADLTRRGVAQAARFGAEVVSPQRAHALRTDGPYHVLTLGDGSEVTAYAVILAPGIAWRTLDAPGLAELTGAGVYYGAARSEAGALAGEEVYVVGGANSAGQAAVYFAEHARTVHMLVRGEALRESMSRYLSDRIAHLPNIAVHPRTAVAAAHASEGGDGAPGGSGPRLAALTLRDVRTGVERRVEASALFVFIGAEPRTDWLDGVVARDAEGFLLTGTDLPMAAPGIPRGWTAARPPFALETSLPGVFAAGDVRHDANRRVASAVGEGGMAVSFVHKYLRAAGVHP